MELEQYYRTMWEQARPQLQANALALDPDADRRFGLTLRIRPGAAVRQAVQPLVDELRRREPEQYYYPDTDRHVTVLSLISSRVGFALDQIEPAAYVALATELLRPVPGFGIDYRGITASAGAVLLQGFPQADALNVLRDRLRIGFGQSPLPLTMDERYVIQTAHSTLVRFRTPLRRPLEFVRVLESYREQAFGAAPVTEVELVFNDWYHRAALVKTLARFPLTR